MMEYRHIILDTAFSQLGIRELPGIEKNSPEIMKYFETMGEKWVKTDETAWCSAAMNWICMVNGLEHSGKLNARSWLNVGRKTKIPKPGNIVVFWRSSIDSWKGHVGIFLNDDGNYIHCLGGNQSNEFRISLYPKKRVLGYIEI